MRETTKIIRDFIINNVTEHDADIVSFTAKNFDITAQAVILHIKKLIEEHILVSTGNTKARRYVLVDTERTFSYTINNELAEDVVWREDIDVFFNKFADNVQRIWNYAFSEMFNNAMDHSSGTRINVLIKQNAKSTTVLISDNGVGIFNKVGDFLNISDVREIVTELSKGKFTTDRKNHTGEGIFFTSRIMDRFIIFSGTATWMHDYDKKDWLIEIDDKNKIDGTCVSLNLANNSTRTLKEMFDKFGNPDFDSTLIPVRLLSPDRDGLVSRSQARRLLSRLDTFKYVVLDFDGIDSIGQAFADEIFRVFKIDNPNIEISFINANKDVSAMIKRAHNLL